MFAQLSARDEHLLDQFLWFNGWTRDDTDLLNEIRRDNPQRFRAFIDCAVSQYASMIRDNQEFNPPTPGTVQADCLELANSLLAYGTTARN